MEPTQNDDLGNLNYKTMPQGKSFSDMKFEVQKPAPAPAPMPAPIPKPMGMPTPTPVPLASHPPIPAEIKPVQTLEGFDMQASSGSSGSGGMGKWLKIGLISVAVLVILGAGWFAYKSFFGSKPAPAVTTTTNSQVTTPVSKIPSDWMMKYFNTATCTDQATCGDDADPDHDGLTNYQEYQHLTDPNNPDSDKDGLADGDEVNIFGSNPNNADTGGDPKYTDDVQAKTKWSTQAPIHQFTDAELKQISANIAQYGLHNPTIDTLGQDLVDFYTNYGGTSASSSTNGSSNSSATGGASSNTDALDRDTQRSDTIKQIGYSLLTYYAANLNFPNTAKWDDMILALKPLIQNKAINTADPKNVAPYIYTYSAVSGGSDFKIGYYSETQNQAVTFSAMDIHNAELKDISAQNDSKRKANLEDLATALERYAGDHANLYPAQATWKTDLSSGQKYIDMIPTDPVSGKDYTYTVSANKDSYAVQAVLESPPTGKKGYVCGPDSCNYY